MTDKHRTDGEYSGIPWSSMQEIEALTALRNSKQEPVLRAPKLIEYKLVQQEPWMWVPESVVVMILMTRCDGAPMNLRTFYSTDLAKRDQLRESFVQSMRFVAHLSGHNNY